MKAHFYAYFCTFLACIAHTLTHAQTNYLYDQQSALENSGGGSVRVIQSNQPFGQSFTPSLAGIGFIRLWMGDADHNGVASEVVLRLRDTELPFFGFGPVLAETTSQTIPDGYQGYVTFEFSAEVPATPGKK